MTNKNLIITSFLGMLSVILGAFGAHALKDVLNAETLLSYETAVRYMMYHAIVLLFLNGSPVFDEKSKNRLSSIFFTGILFFSGSILMISLGAVPARSIWFITPLGGILLIAGWLGMILSLFRKKKHSN